MEGAVLTYPCTFHVDGMNSTEGGNAVMVHGDGFPPTAVCYFGSTMARSTVISGSVLRAVAPPHPPGVVSVRVLPGMLRSTA